MDFQLTQDQETIRDMVRDFARNEIAPHALEWDEEQHFPRELFSKLGELMDRQSKPMAMHNTAPCGVPASSPQIPTILSSA